MTIEQTLIVRAVEARKNSYSPYSHFAVGAALLCEDGSIYVGCNIENASFTPTVCAERAAIFSAVSDGKRKFTAIAVVGGKGKDIGTPCYPCGVCRQVLREFCEPEKMRILLKNGDEISEYKLCELLPNSFGPNFL